MATTNNPYPQAPRFTSNNQGGNFPPLSNAAATAIATRGTPATLNLDDIFGDCFFTPEGETVFLSDQPENERQEFVASTETNPAYIASRITNGDSATSMEQVPQAGGINTTNLNNPNQPASVMGNAQNQQSLPQISNMQPKAQQDHHMGYVVPGLSNITGTPTSSIQNNVSVGSGSTAFNTGVIGGSVKDTAKKRRQRPGTERKMSEQQKTERRERNREHAKRSRIRKKFLLESLQQSVALLKEENESLRNSIRTHLGEDQAAQLLSKQNLQQQSEAALSSGLIASDANNANKVLDDPDFSFIKALQTAQQNFVVTDPSLPDNPIVYATQGFLNLTGYTLDQVLGRNCRFLQGPETDPKSVEKIRKSIEDGTDMSVCLLNYRIDGTTFWNQFFIAALRDAEGNITNYVGVQCKVSDQYAANVCKKQEEADNAALQHQAEGSNLSSNDNNEATKLTDTNFAPS